MDRFGPWTLTARLPSEGRLEVWEATSADGQRAHLRHLPGPVLLSDDEQRGFFDNLRNAEGARHPALLTVLEGGEHDRDFYVAHAAPPAGATTLLELRQSVRPSGGMTIGQVLRVGEQLARALQALHEVGAYHGALDARSVFLDDDGEVLLGRTAAAALTRETPDEPLGTADDVRRLGALLWESLVDRKLLFGAPEPPSSLRSDVPTAVDAALVRALSEAPQDRFATAAAFATALKNAHGALDGRAAHSAIGPLVKPEPERPARAPEPKALDIPIFEAEPRRGPPPYMWFAVAGGAFLFMGFLFAGMLAFVGRSTNEMSRHTEQMARQADPGADAAAIELAGPNGQTERLPPWEPTIFQVWLQGCADCMPKFEMAKRIRARGELAGIPIVNVAYGKVDPGWARSYGVQDRLVTDGGDALVNPLGIGTFTTLLMYPDGRYVVLPMQEDAYASALRRALTRDPQTGDRRWTPRR